MITSLPFTPSDEQRAIIDHPREPLRISAGAGTGKTTTIVQRLTATLIAGADPARALGITFTNKAADELRDRLRLAVPERADGREIEVATYHSFASGILDEFGGRIGHTRGAVLMDEGHRFELAARVLRSLDETPLDLTKIPNLRKDLLAVADALNDNLIDADDVLATMPPNADDVWVTRAALLAAASEFHRRKDELGLIEYSDLIRRAVMIVEAHEDVAESIAARYDTVLLDEYQDTDRAQRRLLTRVFASTPSVTAVGDTDQTIYEWRGASLENFEAFPEDFPTRAGLPAPTLPLSINRRSDRLIIDLANVVRGHLPQIGDATPLRPRAEASEGEVVAAWLRTDLDEAGWIAEQVGQRHADGVAFVDMAVLCRRRESLRIIADAFRSAEIPFSISSMSDLLHVPEVADLVAWLRLLADPSNEVALLRILMGGRYRLGMADIAVLSRSVRREAGQSLIDAVLSDNVSETVTPSCLDAIGAFGSLFRGVFTLSQASSVAASLDAVIDSLHYWDEVAALPPHAATTARLNITRFVDLAGRWRPIGGTADIAGFLRYLDALAEPGRAEELDAVEPPTEDAVLLVTAHGAKGLEWSDVYLPDLAHNVFPSGVRNYYEPLSTAVALPYGVRLDADSIADVAALDDPDARKRLLKVRHDHQEWRLAYVAVTRAKRRLVLSGHAWHGDNKTPRKPSQLLTDATALPGATVGPWIDDVGIRPESAPFHPPPEAPDPLFDEGWPASLRRAIEDPEWIRDRHTDLADRIEAEVGQLEMILADLAEPRGAEPERPFMTSVTNLVALAECPLKFRWIHHDRLPRRPMASAVRGTEFHRKVELHNLGIIPLTDATEADYDGEVGDDSGDAGLRGGADPWESFLGSRFEDATPILVETPFAITFDGRTLRGKVDAVYETSSGWEIVDYKSGAATDTDTKRVQLQAYAVAVRAGALGIDSQRPLDVTFAFFGENPPIEVTEHADEAWLGEAERTMSDLLRVAQEGPFDPTPSAACRWCDFLHHCDAGTAHLRQSKG
ncbi:MAG TPA: ATP-dependent DNA helicase [Acidimicrobiia bacterium]|nr:ATP-dependent DNA helicase [Acidimicrobiia bacterium]